MKENLIIQLSQATGLTVMYAGQCLEGNAWNLEAARANYENVRVSFAALSLRLRPLILRLFPSYSKPLPPDAFLARS